MTPELEAMTRPPVTIIRFTIPPEVWLTSNRHEANRAVLARKRRSLHALAAAHARAQRLRQLEWPVGILWTVHYPKGTGWSAGDASNAQPATKALLDGLVQAGLLPDDGPRHVHLEAFTRGPNLDRPRDHDITAHISGPEAA